MQSRYLYSNYRLSNVLITSNSLWTTNIFVLSHKMQTTGLFGAYTPKYYTVNFVEQNTLIRSNSWLAQRGILYKGDPNALRKKVLKVE